MCLYSTVFVLQSVKMSNVEMDLVSGDWQSCFLMQYAFNEIFVVVLYVRLVDGARACSKIVLATACNWLAVVCPGHLLQHFGGV